MNDLVLNDISKYRYASLAGMARSITYYKRRVSKAKYNMDLEPRFSDIVNQMPSCGIRRVVIMIRRSRIRE